MLDRKYVGNALSLFGSDEIEGGLVELDIEGVAVQEENGADGLILSGGGCFALDDKVGDELVDFRHSHFFWVALVVKEDVFTNPLDVGFFGTERILFEANVVSEAVEKFFFFWECCGCCFWAFRHFLSLSG